MTRHYAAIFTDLERHSAAWQQTLRENVVAIISEYRYLSERLASQYGAFHQNFTGDGHLFLFIDADAAVHFGVELIGEWRKCYENVHVLREVPRISLRLGCHYGECFALEDDWIGRGIALAKRVEAAAASDMLYVTENVLELIDLARFEFEQAGEHELKGDFLPKRSLYCVIGKQMPGETPDVPRETPEALFLRAAQSQDENEEEEYLRRALELRHDYPEAHNNLAIVLRKRGKTDDAAEHYRQALKHRPDYPEAHYNYAFLLESMGRLDGALEHVTEAIRLRPTYVDAHHRAANLFARNGDFDEAAKHYDEAIDLRPTYSEAHNNYAILHENCDRAELAEVHYKQAIRLKPDYAPALYNYGLLLEERGEPEEAEHLYRQALDIWPDYPEAHNNLAILLHQSGNLPEAEAHYRAAVELRPNDPEAHHNLALLLKARGVVEEAEQHFAIAKELLPPQEQFVSDIDAPD